MRQLNFLLFFVLCFGLVLFSIENTQTAAINLIPGVQIEAPLSIELLVAVGTGAILAWAFSVWDQLQRQVDSWKAQRELKQKNKKIEELEKTLAEFQEETASEVEEKDSSSQNEAPKMLVSADETAMDTDVDQESGSEELSAEATEQETVVEEKVEEKN